jgi:hypothetical protein
VYPARFEVANVNLVSVTNNLDGSYDFTFDQVVSSVSGNADTSVSETLSYSGGVYYSESWDGTTGSTITGVAYHADPTMTVAEITAQPEYLSAAAPFNVPVTISLATLLYTVVCSITNNEDGSYAIEFNNVVAPTNTSTPDTNVEMYSNGLATWITGTWQSTSSNMSQGIRITGNPTDCARIRFVGVPALTVSFPVPINIPWPTSL